MIRRYTPQAKCHAEIREQNVRVPGDGLRDVAAQGERLVKSAQRVRDLGEVLTPTSTVQAMLNMLPADLWACHPSPTFLEPSCGDGNFLVAVFDRKARVVADAYAAGTLPAGGGRHALLFHLLEALSAVYGVDISPENIDGSQPDHPLGARERMLVHFQRWARQTLGRRLATSDNALRAARWIVSRNVQIGNMVPLDANGKDAGPPCISLISYTWNPEAGTVELRTTTLADVIAAVEDETSRGESLFPPPSQTLLWEGESKGLHQAPGSLPDSKPGTPRNGRGRRGT